MPKESTKPLNLFYCYAREDKIFRDELDRHLSLLKRQKQITSWSDREIGPGVEWEKEVDSHLNTAQLILLLVSADFLASDYCYGVEMKRALERHSEGVTRVIPILLRPVYWEDAPFSHLQVLPTDAKPISQWRDRDEAWREIALDISKAIKELRLLLRTKEEWLDEGKQFRNLNHFEEALSAYEQAIRLDPTFAASWKGKGWTLYHLNRYDDALAAFEQAIYLNPNSSDSWKGKGWAFYRLGRYDDALAAFEQSVRLDPNSGRDAADSWDGKGWAFYRLRRYDDALVAFEQVLQLNPDRDNAWDAWDGKGWAFYRLGRYYDALAAFEQALRIDPDSTDSWDGKANSLSKLKRPQEAEYAYEKVRQLRSK